MAKINISGVIYDTLGSLKLNGREYVFGIEANNLEYFEKIENEYGINYAPSKKDYTLEGNAGSSLIKLKERVVMQHIADTLKEDIKTHKINGVSDITNFISTMQQVFDEEENLKKLFKGDPTDLDEDKFVISTNNLIKYLDTKRRAKEKKDVDFDILEGGVDKTFITNPNINHPSITPTDKIDDTYEELSPTIIVDQLVKVPKQEVVEETKKEEPSTSIIGIDDKDLTNDMIKTVLTKKQDFINKEQEEYLEKILETREKEENVPQPEEQVENDDIKLSYDEFMEVKQRMNSEPQEEVEVEQPKRLALTKPKNNRAAYVDTVILCLLTQLGIFGLLIFILLLIK